MGIFKPQSPVIDRIASGRTDLVFDLVGAGQPATFCDAGGASLISTCAYYGDVNAICSCCRRESDSNLSARTLGSSRQRSTGTGSSANSSLRAVRTRTTPTRTLVRRRYTLRSAQRIGPDAVWR